ncbi:MAG: hypothetical protein JSV88_28670 [Candidatus Aminicenantes bacterium]|nr:MAG: hypothetical protein JSV88_28670 [Candidatus Aminicenantes bacterium]
MYSKEQIIEEIKRIAEIQGGKSLTEKDFERHSTVPLSTLRFHLGSWKRALKEAGLDSVQKTPPAEPKNDDELLLDLIRLNEDSGELPTLALINTKGKYSVYHYKERWKSIAEAFQAARKKFPEKFKSPPKISHIPQAEPVEHVEHVEQIENAEQVEQMEPMRQWEQENQKDSLEKASEEEIYEPLNLKEVEVEGEREMTHDRQGIKTQTIKFIPQTIKPQKAKMKPRVPLEPVDFRGLRFAPSSRQGVTYLFGMISQELGFIIESFISQFPDCEGKRCVDQENNQWEQVRIQLEYKSSDFKTRTSTKGYDESQCDLIICWNHDWEESPIEVLELRSILQYLTQA